MKSKTQVKTAAPIRVGVIGLGRAGYGMQCQELAARPDKYTIVAGCDIRPERLARFTELTGVTATYLDWKDLLREIKPDVVDVCTPNGVHAPAVIDALNAGCHAMTEKPMAMTPAECRDMIAAGKKNKRQLSC